MAPLIVKRSAAIAAAAILFAGMPARASAPREGGAARELEACLARAIDPFLEDRCHNAFVARQEAWLDQALAGARRYLVRRQRETTGAGAVAMEDQRRDPAYLDRSQAAWREYVEQDCTVRAGLLWGGNVWVSRGERSCYLEELERRIAFLESVASGQFEADAR